MFVRLNCYLSRIYPMIEFIQDTKDLVIEGIAYSQMQKLPDILGREYCNDLFSRIYYDDYDIELSRRKLLLVVCGRTYSLNILFNDMDNSIRVFLLHVDTRDEVLLFKIGSIYATIRFDFLYMVQLGEYSLIRCCLYASGFDKFTLYFTLAFKGKDFSCGYINNSRLSSASKRVLNSIEYYNNPDAKLVLLDNFEDVRNIL